MRKHRDIGYARLSHADPDEAGAIARQKADIHRVSEATGGELVGPILVDNAVSASRYARRKRKDYPKLLAMARAGMVDRAVIYDVDRLLRIPRELEDLIDLVEELGDNFTVVGVNGSMDLTTSQGIYHARISVADAAKASDDTSRRLRRTFDQYAEAGLPLHATGKNRPFGYTDGGLTVDDTEAALIRDAASAVLDGEGLNTVAGRWNQAGITSRRGGLWSNRTVRSVLVSPRTAGRRMHRGEDVGPGVWPAILDPETVTRLCRMFDGRTRQPGRRTPFTGLFVTTDGRPMRRDMISKQQRHVYRTYSPAPGVDGPRSVTIGPAETLEALTLEVLFQDIESGGVAARIAERRRSRPVAVGEDPAVVQAELNELAADKANGGVTRGEWLTMRRPLERRLVAAERAAALVAAAGAMVLEAVDVDIRERWGGYSDDRRRQVLHGLFERVEVAPAFRRGPGFDASRVTPVARG